MYRNGRTDRWCCDALESSMMYQEALGSNPSYLRETFTFGIPEREKHGLYTVATTVSNEQAQFDVSQRAVGLDCLPHRTVGGRETRSLI